jgi:hypothetical protein
VSAKGMKSLFFVGQDILYSEASVDKKNTILVQTGNATVDEANSTGGSPAEWWQHVGFASRPSPVSSSGKNADAAQGIVINRSDFDIVVASRDTRYQSIYGSLKPGETCLYSTGSEGKSQARILLKDNGSINLFTSAGNATGGAGMGIFVDPAGSITMATPSKCALMLSDDGAKLFSPKGAVQITDASTKISSTGKVLISAPAIVLGGPAAMPVATLTDITALATAITTALALILPGPTTPGGAPAAAALTASMASITASMMAKRVSAD